MTHTAPEGEAARPEIQGYEVYERLGSGPLGTSWRARAATGREVCLKVLSDLAASRANFVTVFEKETAAYGSMRHPQIVPLVDRGRSKRYFIATEFVPGGSLRDRLGRGVPFGAEEAIRIAVDVCRALVYAHSRATVHRSLKPENVFLTGSGAKVSDFGMALLAPLGTKGTPYHPPEAMFRADTHADLYAVASMLHELVTGKLLAGPFRPVDTKSRWDATLNQVLAKALAPRVQGRFPHVQDFMLALEGQGHARPAAPGAEASALSVVVEGGVVHATVSAQATAESLRQGMGSLENVLRDGGPWKLVYDLSGLKQMGVVENDLLISLHQRNLARITHLAFCSPVPQVRGSALVVASSVRGPKWKVFEGTESMRRWIGAFGAAA